MATGEPAGNRESLAQAGEFTVIDRLVAGRVQPDEVTLGPGDDAAVVSAPDGRTVVSTDMLVAGRHFRLDWSSPHDIGRKAIAQNAADVEAMGARAVAFVVAFGAPGKTAVDAALELADGLWDEARTLGAGIVGGDMVSAPQWVVSVTVLGDLGGRPPVRRDGARAGDTLAVIGDLGWSAAGYALWDNEIDGSGKSGGEASYLERLRRRHLVPAPPYGAGRAAADAGATAMTDVSDGLLADLGHLAESSAAAIDVSTDALAADVAGVRPAAMVLSADPWQWVLGGGEDHALVATFPDAPPPGWRVIGQVRPGPPSVTVDGAGWGGNTGWQSF